MTRPHVCRNESSPLSLVKQSEHHKRAINRSAAYHSTLHRLTPHESPEVPNYRPQFLEILKESPQQYLQSSYRLKLDGGDVLQSRKEGHKTCLIKK